MVSLKLYYDNTKFEYATKMLNINILLIVISIVANPTRQQICDKTSRSLPNGHVCNQNLHIYHHDYEAINRYCGSTITNQTMTLER